MRFNSLTRFACSFSMLATLSLGVELLTVTSAQPANFEGEEMARVVDPIMNEWLAHGGTGAVVVVTRRDGPIFAKGYGFADSETKRLFTPDRTLLRPGSISKLFAGIAVMQLVDQGKVDLDRDVSDYIGFPISTPPGGEAVTLRRLLTHSAGFEDHIKNLYSSGPKPMELGLWVAKSLPLRLFPAGSVPAYSNYGVALAGYVVERVSGEAYPEYVERHILKPLRMDHSTFRQPLPERLAPLMARGYRGAGRPPLNDFETIHASPAGALSATGEDMERFMRALLNGGQLDGAQILPRARLEEMLTPSDRTEAGWLGLVFFGRRIGGVEAIGHGGATQAFFSDLEIFREHGLGVFVSRDGYSDQKVVPDPVKAIVEHFLPASPSYPTSTRVRPSRLVGVYQSSRRSDSTFFRISALLAQRLVTENSDGSLSFSSASWPFGSGEQLKRIGENVYENSTGRLLEAVDDVDPYFAAPALRLLRVPWFLNARWIVPAVLASSSLMLATLLAYPAIALWRHWRKLPSRHGARDRRLQIAVQFFLLLDMIVIAGAAFIFAKVDPGQLDDEFDPVLLAIYALAWLGVLGAGVAVFAAFDLWRRRVGGLWIWLHQCALAASALMIAYVFVMFHIAGTTLNY